MNIFAAVMTGKGTGAIATIQVFGEGAKAVLQKIFAAGGDKTAVFKTGAVLLGKIIDGQEVIDEVVVGCEGENNLAINCHGNPLIVEMIMQLLSKNGAALITAEQLLAKVLSVPGQSETIAIEAQISQSHAKTIQGTKLILGQIEAGLNKKAKEWLAKIDTINLGELRAEAERILQKSQAAETIMFGCTIAIAGPPNTGKSTLLNYLCGREKAIVADSKGTTRDWVSAECRIGSLAAEIIDTAGLDEKLAAEARNNIEWQAQQRSVEVLRRAGLILFVLDGSEPIEQVDMGVVREIAGKKVLTVVNKSDLTAKLDLFRLPEILLDTVLISAKTGYGMEILIDKIQELCGGVMTPPYETPVCFTSRQENLLKCLCKVQTKDDARAAVSELLNGQL